MLPGPFEGAGFFIAIDTHPTPYYPIIISIFPVLKCTEDVQKMYRKYGVGCAKSAERPEAFTSHFGNSTPA